MLGCPNMTEKNSDHRSIWFQDINDSFHISTRQEFLSDKFPMKHSWIVTIRLALRWRVIYHGSMPHHVIYHVFGSVTKWVGLCDIPCQVWNFSIKKDQEFKWEREILIKKFDQIQNVVKFMGNLKLENFEWSK